MNYSPLSREEVISVIEGKGGASRVPIMLHFWMRPETFSDPARAKTILDAYPQDVQNIWLNIPQVFDCPEDDRSYRWSWRDAKSKGGALDADGIIEDWETDLEPLLADFPSADYPALTKHNPPEDGRYRLGAWWYFFFERFWSLRGMENALMDFYLYPDEVHALFRRLTDFYKRMLERGKEELKLDGVFTSDDLGTQNDVFFSTKIFDEFFAPYYKEVIEHAHRLGMHFWLHTCGNVTKLLPKFIDLGLDVIHPIQKYAMDEKTAARDFGDKIAIWAGFDVQKTIPFGTADDVRREVRYMMDAYAREDGRFLFTLGNNATKDTPLDSLEALYEEAYGYGRASMAKFGK